MTVEIWGDEIYSSAIPVKADEKNAKSKVELYDVAYWPEGSALCFFFGPTPISKAGEILPYSPVNVIGTIKSRPPDVQRFLRSVKESHVDKKSPSSPSLAEPQTRLPCNNKDNNTSYVYTASGIS
ncbi:MAG: cyclophilin-like family protein [Nitrososphaera sp.]|jgi:hypothetical protein